MRLLEKFGISGKSKVKNCQRSKIVENRTKIRRFFLVLTFAKIFWNYQNFLQLSKILVYFWHFQHSTVYVEYKWPKFDQIQPSWSKMTQKMVENHENYTGILDFLPKMANFLPFGKCQKCTKPFVFLFSRKSVLYQSSKLLQECMALALTKPNIVLNSLMAHYLNSDCDNMVVWSELM